MLVSKKACGANANPSICVTPTRTPNASRCNIGRVGYPTQEAGIGHVDFVLFVFFSFALVTQHEPSFQWNMGFKDRQHRSRGGSDFPLITQEPKGVDHRVIYQMKGNIYLYPMILSNRGSRAN